MANLVINNDTKTVFIKGVLDTSDDRSLYLVFSNDTRYNVPSASANSDVTSFIGGASQSLVYVVKIDVDSDVYIGINKNSNNIPEEDKVTPRESSIGGDEINDFILKNNLNKYLTQKFTSLTVVKEIDTIEQEEYKVITLIKSDNLTNDEYDFTNSTPDNTLFNEKKVQLIGQYVSNSSIPLPQSAGEETPKVRIDIKV